MVAMIDGQMIIRLIENPEEFNKYVEERLKMMNNRQNDEKPTSTIAEDNQENTQNDNSDVGYSTIDSETYKVELRDMMMAVAHGIGNTPVNVMVEEGSFLLKAYEVEVLRIQKEQIEQQEKSKRIKIEKEIINNNNNNNNNNRDVEMIVVPRKTSFKKKGSFNLMNFCGCTGKQIVDNS